MLVSTPATVVGLKDFGTPVYILCIIIGVMLYLVHTCYNRCYMSHINMMQLRYKTRIVCHKARNTTRYVPEIEGAAAVADDIQPDI